MFFFSVLISLCLLWLQLSFKNTQASFRLAHLVTPSVNRGVRVDINQGNSQLHSCLQHMWVQLSDSFPAEILYGAESSKLPSGSGKTFSSHDALSLCTSVVPLRWRELCVSFPFWIPYFFFFWSIGIGNGKQKENYVETYRIGFMIYQDLEIHRLKVDAWAQGWSLLIV